MTTLQQHISNEQRLGDHRNRNAHHSFIATKTIAHVLAKVKPALSNRKLVDLPVTATIEQTFRLLLAEDILSVPVYQLDSSGRKIYLTIVSVLDLLNLFSQYTDDITKSNFFQHQITEAIGQTKESSRLVMVQYSDALVDVLRLFGEYGAHRVLVSGKGNQDDEPPVFLSQMDIMRYLQAHNHHLGAILDKTVPELIQRISQRRRKRLHIEHQPPLATLTFKTTAIKAFEQMGHDSLISALPILDDNGYLVGDISPRDLRGLNEDRLNDLSKPVLMFLKSSHGALLAPITCHRRFTLSQLMAAFVLRKTSRLWYIDQEGRVQGVITLTDVLDFFSDDNVNA